VRDALRITWITLQDWWNGMVGLASLNLLWLGLSLTGVLLPPATLGMYAVTNSIAHGKGQHLDDFLQAVRSYLWISLRWALVNLLVGGVLFVNLTFYGAADSPITMAIQLILLGFSLLWIAMQFYIPPFLIEQEDKRLRLALRNAAFLALATPIYTLTLLFIAALVITLSLAAILPVAVFTMGFLSLLGNRATIERLSTFGKLPSPSLENRYE